VDVLKPQITPVSVQIPLVQDKPVTYEVPVYREKTNETVYHIPC